MKYDDNNVFLQIINGILEQKIEKETKYSIRIQDKYPDAKIHKLIIPKSKYINLYDFLKKSTDEEKLDLLSLIKNTLEEYGIENGNKVITNSGKDGNQKVFHLHFHILGGEKIRFKDIG